MDRDFNHHPLTAFGLLQYDYTNNAITSTSTIQRHTHMIFLLCCGCSAETKKNEINEFEVEERIPRVNETISHSVEFSPVVDFFLF